MSSTADFIRSQLQKSLGMPKQMVGPGPGGLGNEGALPAPEMPAEGAGAQPGADPMAGMMADPVMQVGATAMNGADAAGKAIGGTMPIPGDMQEEAMRPPPPGVEDKFQQHMGMADKFQQNHAANMAKHKAMLAQPMGGDPQAQLAQLGQEMSRGQPTSAVMGELQQSMGDPNDPQAQQRMALAQAMMQQGAGAK